MGTNRKAPRPRKPAPGRSLLELHPDIAADWHPTKNGDVGPGDVSSGSGFYAAWRCAKCGHEWPTTVSARSIGRGCRPCASVKIGRARSTPTPGKSLADVYPDVAAEWHPSRNGDLRPQDVKPAAGTEVVWLCGTCSHEWPAPVNNRTRGTGCSKCAEKDRARKQATPAPGESLADLRPDVAADWHPTKNGDVTPWAVNVGSVFRAEWRCHVCGHEWPSVVGSRTRPRGSGCSECAKLRIGASRSTPKAGESLQDLFPNLAKEWHPTKNGDLMPSMVKPGARNRVNWVCSACGYEWPTRVNDRAKTPVGGCPTCAEYGFNAAAPAVVYFLHHPDLDAHKVGIAGEGSGRLSKFVRAGWTVVHSRQFATGAAARSVEKAVHTWWRDDLNLPVWLAAADMSGLRGHTETIAATELSEFEIISRIAAEASRVATLEREADCVLAA
ncbi:zinc-ribbon domain-containing protein [Curtobacterium sp. MCSS17_016]|uniref:zinc-ribbon domain-containing protein n=1 Tax=Curtobacterium sp. MCSS17_016 TaxID=2175644 RepID=UPI000DA83E37|nr:zinc-ribbon domain-containing protein [Curtobacterium sp. MCSS17_016]WIE81350.1 zinc-ribbon domain-containing protein [Curtobacterium sp. MCSS17_016]